jgi:hypothetical protein
MALCEALGVTIQNFSEDEKGGCAFLGSGANGRVFRLSNGAAIKVVVGPKSCEVKQEFNLMVKYQEQNDIQPCDRELFPQWNCWFSELRWISSRSNLRQDYSSSI